MTQNAPDINHFPFVFDRGDQPALIVADIEHNKGPDNIRVPPTVPNLSEVFPTRSFGYFVPRT
jgi:hypothetical protein